MEREQNGETGCEGFIGRNVVHTIFGKGTIKSAEPRYFTVAFDMQRGTRLFVFPEAFCCHLRFEDTEIQSGAENELAKAREQAGILTEAVCEKLRLEAKTTASPRRSTTATKKKTTAPRKKAVAAQK